MKSDAKDEVKEIKKEPKFDLKDVEVEDGLDFTHRTLKRVSLASKKVSSLYRKTPVIINKHF